MMPFIPAIVRKLAVALYAVVRFRLRGFVRVDQILRQVKDLDLVQVQAQIVQRIRVQFFRVQPFHVKFQAVLVLRRDLLLGRYDQLRVFLCQRKPRQRQNQRQDQREYPDRCMLVTIQSRNPSDPLRGPPPLSGEASGHADSGEIASPERGGGSPKG